MAPRNGGAALGYAAALLVCIALSLGPTATAEPIMFTAVSSRTQLSCTIAGGGTCTVGDLFLTLSDKGTNFSLLNTGGFSFTGQGTSPGSLIFFIDN